MTRSFRFSLSFCCLLTVTCASQAAEIYRWVDDDGVLNYTQQKPRGIEVDELITRAGAPTRIRSQKPAAAPINEDALPLQDQDLTDAQQSMFKDLQAREQDRLDEIARVRSENCDKSRSVLSKLSAKERIRVRDDAGIERMMSEDERQRRIADAQKGIVDNCSAA